MNGSICGIDWSFRGKRTGIRDEKTLLLRADHDALWWPVFDQEIDPSIGSAFATLTRCRLISCPDFVVIRALLSVGWLVVGLKKTSRASASECSALKLAGFPMTMELISSGSLTEVAYPGARCNTVTDPSSTRAVVTAGTIRPVGVCATTIPAVR